MARRVLALVAAGALALTAVPAHAYVPDETPKRHLEAKIRRTIALPAARPATAGILVLRGGRTAIAINADRSFRPASLLKLATTTAAVMRFGPAYRFTTRVVGTRPVAGVTGTVWLVGGGDPTFASSGYRKEHFIPKPDDPIPVPVFASGSPTVEGFADLIVRAGIRRVAGDLMVDDTIFDGRRTQPGWIPDYQRNDPDIGNIDGLTVNEGFADVKGDHVAPQPAINAGLLLKGALAARGVVVTGAVRHGRAPRDRAELARVLSPPLSEIVQYTNRYSANYPAEMLLKGLGARFGGGGTTVQGVAVVRAALNTIRMPLDGLVMADGSGLSLFNRARPRMLAAILQWILTAAGPDGNVLRATLPVAGGPGTLFKRMNRWPTLNNLRGKTGFIRHVRGMAGWVTPLDGVPLVYVALFNDVPKPLALTSPLDLIGTALAFFGGIG
jgi:serine-type D-Ala-D-Ala carboxypeptidase/endopeptidase (penicillin-binding protein 4)